MPEQVETWCADPALVRDLDAPALLGLLDDDERERHARLRFEEDAHAFLLAHALRRVVLARRLGVAPDSLAFAPDALGMPVLTSPVAGRVCASLSRSRCGVAVALSEAFAVGVDIEAVDPARADFELFAPWLRWDTVQPEHSAAAFHMHWTALEAFWKAMGTGLADGNALLCCEPDGDGLLLRFASGEAAPAGRVRWLDAGPGCALAVATRGAQRPGVAHHRITSASDWQALQRPRTHAASEPAGR